MVLTFDDGYESLYTRVFPLLLRYGTKATVYLIVSRMGQSRRGQRYLSADQIRRMDQSGLVEFGSRTGGGRSRPIQAQPRSHSGSPGDVLRPPLRPPEPPAGGSSPAGRLHLRGCGGKRPASGAPLCSARPPLRPELSRPWLLRRRALGAGQAQENAGRSQNVLFLWF
ncbi:MAG: polysaccharide deacetylase family protein [Betaproteobacteria bacterium]